MIRPLLLLGGAWLSGALSLSPLAQSADLQLSGFGTLGGAISDQDFIYQRFIDDGGTLNRDSVLGLQLDLALSNAWSLTIQGEVAPSTSDENAWEPSLSWAFLSWRPTNDLLLRAGKVRLPLMLYTANSDVGITFEFARLPTEVYSLMPTTDVVGLSASRTWLQGDREWTLEGYAGHASAYWRYFLREALEPLFPAGPVFVEFDLDMAGLVASMRTGESTFRIGAHRASAVADYGSVPKTVPFVTLFPGVGYYQISDTMPGPGVPTTDELIVYLFTAGADIALPHDFRLIGEYARRRFANATLGPDTNAGYLALLKRIGPWTPYVYWSGIRSTDKALDLATSMNENRVPDFIPGATAINRTQRSGSDLLNAYDQHSLAIGASYSLSPTSRIKAEWMHTWTGRLSSFVNSPVDEDSGGREINVFSLSYSLAF